MCPLLFVACFLKEILDLCSLSDLCSMSYESSTIPLKREKMPVDQSFNNLKLPIHITKIFPFLYIY